MQVNTRSLRFLRPMDIFHLVGHIEGNNDGGWDEGL